MTGFLKSLFSGEPKPGFDPLAWQETLNLPVFEGVSNEALARLETLARQLIEDKTFSGAAGQALDASMVTRIAALAALPVLNLGYEAYLGWNEIIVYPGEFVPEREVMDDYGVVHQVRQPMSGEAWEGGPLVLSWDDVVQSGYRQGFNVVIHEFVHKLDMLNGAVDGLPVLAAGKAIEDWSAAFTQAYADFCRRLNNGELTTLDPYAAENPAEFLAVLAEAFFELPEVLHEAYPAVYEQLRCYFKQDPLERQHDFPTA